MVVVWNWWFVGWLLLYEVFINTFYKKSFYLIRIKVTIVVWIIYILQHFTRSFTLPTHTFPLHKTHYPNPRTEQKNKTISIVIGVVCAIILVLLVIVCVVVFLLLSRRRLKRCPHRGTSIPPPSLTNIAVIFNSPDAADGKSRGTNQPILFNNNEMII